MILKNKLNIFLISICTLLFQATMQNNNFIVLLTMTIAPPQKILLERNKIQDRINDYRKSLTRWAQLPYKVVVIENSGYGNPFKDILQHTTNIQYVSVKIPYDPEKGRGHGEANALKYAVDNIIKSNTVYIMKITGRYAPRQDLSAVLSILQKHRPNVLLKPERTEWFVSKRKFLRDFTNFCIENVDERKGVNYLFDTLLSRFSQSSANVIQSYLNIHVIPTNCGCDLAVITI